MKLTPVTDTERRADKIGAAVDYRLELSEHMGGGIGKRSAWFHLGDSQVLALSDALDSATTIVRDTMLALLWSELDSVVDRLYSDPMTLDDLVEDLGMGVHSEAELRADQFLSWGEDRGKAQGLAYAIAVLLNPRNPDVEAVRAEAVTRHAS